MFHAHSITSEVLPLCYYGHQALRKQSVDIPQITDDINILADRMINTMRAKEGIGLAAPQVGYNINLIVIEVPTNDPQNQSGGIITSPGEINLLPRMPLILLNVRLSGFSHNKTTHSEGCLSIPDISAEVSRSEFVHLDAQSIDGIQISHRCGGMLARCLQHEVDHLNGILFIDLISEKEFRRFSGKLKKLEKRNRL